MIDLAKGPYPLKHKSVTEFAASLQSSLPSHLTIKPTKLRKMPALQVSDGLWRGARLALNDSNKQQLSLTGIYYNVPTFGSKVLLFIICCASLSVIFTILASAITGRLTPVGTVGGLLGAMIEGNVENMISKNTMNSPWASELKGAIERA